jgi:hypothetical protein
MLCLFCGEPRSRLILFTAVAGDLGIMRILNRDVDSPKTPNSLKHRRVPRVQPEMWSELQKTAELLPGWQTKESVVSTLANAAAVIAATHARDKPKSERELAIPSRATLYRRLKRFAVFLFFFK